MTSTPFVGFSNATLAKCPPLKSGDEIDCPQCGGKHAVADSDPPLMLFYECGDETFMAGIDGRSTMGVKSDVSGEI